MNSSMSTPEELQVFKALKVDFCLTFYCINKVNNVQVFNFLLCICYFNQRANLRYFVRNGILLVKHKSSSLPLTLYHTILTFNDPEKSCLLKTLWEKVKMLETSIFTFSHNVFYPSHEEFLF